MDSSMWKSSGSKNSCLFGNKPVSSQPDCNIVKGFHLKDTSYNDVAGLSVAPDVPESNFVDSSYSKSFAEENDFCDVVLNYINQVLMEDDTDDKSCMIQGSTLQAAEQSFYDVLNNRQPVPANLPLLHQDTSTSSDDGTASSVSKSTSSSEESGMNNNLDIYQSFHPQVPLFDCSFLTSSPSISTLGCSSHAVDGTRSHASVHSVSKSTLQHAAIGEDKKMLSREYYGLFGCKNMLLLPEAKEKTLEVEAGCKKHEGEIPPDISLRGRKHLHQEEGNDPDYGRCNKHLAIYSEEPLLREMFDKVLVLCGGKDDSSSNGPQGASSNGMSEEILQNECAKECDYKTIYGKKGVTKREAVDMRSLLTQCMQSLACNDQRGAIKLLRQIRLRSSPIGDGSQRVAHYFADALEARLAGSGLPIYKDVAEKYKTLSDAAVLKAYKLYLSAFPFMMTLYVFVTDLIIDLAEKATSLHVIHFGIVHGLQLLPLIQRLSTRDGGPPKLRVTGIDLPQAGFRPAARVEETGRRLGSYCARFSVPFEYNAIAANWETLSVSNLKIKEDEVVVVYCLYQFMYLLDDTILEDSPRDAVLKLIRKMNPDIFVHGIVNGTYNSPFFISRFREALFHFATLFDMFDVIVPRDNEERMVFEREIWGKEILNVLACEGLERIERPETYKQWQVRTVRAGFRQLPLNQDIVKKLKAMVKSRYHKDFLVDEVNQWVLQGWKGRALFAVSCWKPA